MGILLGEINWQKGEKSTAREGFKSLVKVFLENLNTFAPLAFDTLSVLCCVEKKHFNIFIRNAKLQVFILHHQRYRILSKSAAKLEHPHVKEMCVEICVCVGVNAAKAGVLSDSALQL